MEIAWGLVGALTGSIATLIVALIVTTRNGKPHSNPRDPAAVKAGDMATLYWQSEFRTIIWDELRLFRLEFMEALGKRLGKD